MKRNEFKPRSFEYDPHSQDSEQGVPAAQETPDRIGYYGPTLAPPVIDELNAWANVLNALKDGIPIPYNPAIFVEKVTRIERDLRIDLTELKNSAPPAAEVREAKDFKPYIYAILDRIAEIGELNM